MSGRIYIELFCDGSDLADSDAHVEPRSQAGFSVFIFVLLSSQDGFSTKWHVNSEGVRHAPALYNGAFSTIAFLIGAVTSIISGFLGMKIATYANARTALEARKGIAPAFMAGEISCTSSCHRFLLLDFINLKPPKAPFAIFNKLSDEGQ